MVNVIDLNYNLQVNLLVMIQDMLRLLKMIFCNFKWKNGKIFYNLTTKIFDNFTQENKLFFAWLTVLERICR